MCSFFLKNVSKSTRKNEYQYQHLSQTKSGSVQGWCKLNYISLFQSVQDIASADQQT